jgi:histidyl-tRNA synthetase
MVMSNIEPRTLKGFRDFLPEEEAKRQRMLEVIRNVFERFGFLPLSTPALEYYDVLAGKYGEEGEKLMYRFQDRGKREVAMRYDLTVPLARVVAQYGDKLPKPFKRYQIASVWRGENPQKGRSREFYQCDVDVVGSSSQLADGEVLSAVYWAVAELGAQDIRILYNSRKWLFENLRKLNVPENAFVEVSRTLDKVYKVDIEQIKKELVQKVGDDTLWDRISAITKPKEAEAFEEILASLGVPASCLLFRPTLARGLDYYTGMIFEAVSGGEGSSIAGGGRYDNLIGSFTGKDIPAVGCSIGIDRLFDLLTTEGFQGESAVSVLVMNLDENLIQDCAALATELRKEGFIADFYYEVADLDKQFRYAEKKGIRFAMLYGPDEKASGQVTIKDLAKRKQQKVSREEFVKEIRKLLNA